MLASKFKHLRKTKTEKEKGLDAPENLKILITIVNREKTSLYIDTLEGFEVNLQTVTYGRGTASSDISQMLGLGETKKSVILSVVKESKIKEILNTYEDKLFKTKNGKGIAFTLPINSTIGVLIYQFLSNHKED